MLNTVLLAAGEGHTECIRLLGKEDPKCVFCVDSLGWPPLLYADFHDVTAAAARSSSDKEDREEEADAVAPPGIDPSTIVEHDAVTRQHRVLLFFFVVDLFLDCGVDKDRSESDLAPWRSSERTEIAQSRS